MGSPKGEVTPFASLFPVEDAHRAVKHVEDSIAEKHKEMDHLKGFIADNSSIVNLVSKLPEELHHDIMVPFGKAAFFPGRLLHTNEFVVLLGEGYYAERTSKQTVEILKRRGKALDSKVESLKANIKDLKAEASFFDATASEAAEGLVEIREDYVEEDPAEEQLKSASKEKENKPRSNEAKDTVEDDEYTRIMARLDELEKEEEELGDEDDDENDEDEPMANGASEDEDEVEEESSASFGQTASHGDQLLYQSQSEYDYQQRKPLEQAKIEELAAEVLSNEYQSHFTLNDEQNCTGLTVQSLPKGFLHGEKGSLLPETRVEAMSSAAEPVHKQSMKPPPSSSKPLASSSGFDSSKAFTGSIVERSTDAFNTTNPATSQPSDSQSKPSKPVSRFKMQRR
ncbi:RNA polymerase II subunit 5-mediating protein homolog [Linum perenne]